MADFPGVLSASGLELDVSDLSEVSDYEGEVVDSGGRHHMVPVARTSGFAVDLLHWTENLEGGDEDSEEVSVSPWTVLM